MENVVKFAEYLMKKYPRADLYPYRSWTYPQGFLLWGYIRLYEKTGREDFYNYILAYCQEHVNEDGELLGYTGIPTKLIREIQMEDSGMERTDPGKCGLTDCSWG